MQDRIYKPKRFKNGVITEGSIYRYRFNMERGSKVFDVSLKTTDKQVARQKAREVFEHKKKQLLGILPNYDTNKLNIFQLLEKYNVYSISTRISVKHSRFIVNSITNISNDCNWQFIKDIDVKSYNEWRVKRSDLSPKTHNEYLAIFNKFLNWLINNRYIEFNPLVSIKRLKQMDIKTKYRRALTQDECNRFLIVSDKRTPLYLTALYTGLRRGELLSLKWGDIILNGIDSFIRVRASTTKNKKSESLPLKIELAEELLKLRPFNFNDGDLVFSGLLHKSREFYNDLKKANIPLIDGLDRIVDFHSLRYTFCTNLALAGVNIRYAMKLMRHSDINLTIKIYTDAGLLDVRPSINLLPNLLDSPKTSLLVDAGSQLQSLEGNYKNSEIIKNTSNIEAKSLDDALTSTEGHKKENGSGSWIRISSKRTFLDSNLSYNTQNSDLLLSISCQKLSKVVFKWELLPENIKNSLYEIVVSFTKGVGNE